MALKIGLAGAGGADEVRAAIFHAFISGTRLRALWCRSTRDVEVLGAAHALQLQA